MDKYIDADTAMFYFCKESWPVIDQDGKATFVVDYPAVIEKIPSANVTRLITAHWDKGAHEPYRCDNCGTDAGRRTPYCPYCGARMR